MSTRVDSGASWVSNGDIDYLLTHLEEACRKRFARPSSITKIIRQNLRDQCREWLCKRKDSLELYLSIAVSYLFPMFSSCIPQLCFCELY